MEIRGIGCIVTGGSRGLGAALGRRLAERGARVVLVARSERELREVVEGIRAAGGEAHGVAADVADEQAVYAAVSAAAALAGPIDLLVHNASTLGAVPLPLVLDTACEDLERVLAVNVVGPHRWTKAIAGSMVLRGRGLIVHVSSDAAVEAYPRWGAYGASKAALEHLARVLAAEIDGTGVRILRVDPGEMDTAMHADAVPDADRSTLADPDEVARRLVDLVERAEELPNGARVEALRWKVRDGGDEPNERVGDTRDEHRERVGNVRGEPAGNVRMGNVRTGNVRGEADEREGNERGEREGSERGGRVRRADEVVS